MAGLQMVGPMWEVDIETAQAQLEYLLDEVEAGQEIVITRDGIQVAKLVPLLPGDAALAVYSDLVHIVR